MTSVWPGRGDGFNPCFNGSVERGFPSSDVLILISAVSILVLMEVLREADVAPVADRAAGVSILVLMEVLREDANSARFAKIFRFQSLF